MYQNLVLVTPRAVIAGLRRETVSGTAETIKLSLFHLLNYREWSTESFVHLCILGTYCHSLNTFTIYTVLHREAGVTLSDKSKDPLSDRYRIERVSC